MIQADTSSRTVYELKSSEIQTRVHDHMYKDKTGSTRYAEKYNVIQRQQCNGPFNMG